MIEQDTNSPLTSSASPSYDTISEVRSKIAGVVTALSGAADKILFAEHAYDTDTSQFDAYIFAGSVTGITTDNLLGSNTDVEVASIAKLLDTSRGSLDLTNLAHTKPSELS